MTRRHVFRWAALVVLALLAWALWPIYGFLSNQYEMARLPFGWMEMAEDAPRSQIVHDDAYRGAGELMLDRLAARRERISAPSMSAAIGVDGKLVWAGAVGWADVASGTAATPETIYRVGSTSKALTATLIARLVARGDVELDVPISNYLQDVPNSAWRDLTLRQLLSHTAGMPAYEENRDWLGFYRSLALRTHYDTAMGSLDMVDGSAMLHAPGEAFHYTGYGTVLASAVAEAVTGESFAKAFDRLVAEPSGAVGTASTPRTLQPWHAVSYQTRGRDVKPWRAVDLSHKTAAGGFSASPSDLVRIGNLWLDEARIPADIREVFWTPVPLLDGTPNPEDYALGWRVKSWPIEGVGEVVHVNHGGVSKGAQAWLMVLPEHDTVLAFTTNRRTDTFFDFADIYVDLLEIALPVSGGSED